MVLAGWEWLVSASHAARRSLCARLLFLSGVVAVAWLAGGFGVAHGETEPESGGLADHVLQAGEGAEGGGAVAREIRDARLSDATEHAASAAETLTDTVVPQAAGLPAGTLRETGVAGALDRSRTGAAANRVVEDTTQVVDDTARGAGEVVDGLAHRSNDVVGSTDQSLREGRLVDTVTDGLTDSTRAVRGELDGGVDTTAPLDLPRLLSPETTASEAADSGPRASDDGEGDADRERAHARTSVHAPVRAAVWHTAAGEAADQTPEDESAERIRFITGGAHHSTGSDATGASAPSFPAPGVAGFLMTRAEHLAPRVQRVALPGDPTLVVRDAADDPSFSPD